jgi:hypothetical protein
MRNLVIERINQLWIIDVHPYEFDITLDRLHTLSNKQLLAMLEDMIEMEE